MHEAKQADSHIEAQESEMMDVSGLGLDRDMSPSLDGVCPRFVVY